MGGILCKGNRLFVQDIDIAPGQCTRKHIFNMYTFSTKQPAADSQNVHDTTERNGQSIRHTSHTIYMFNHTNIIHDEFCGLCVPAILNVKASKRQQCTSDIHFAVHVMFCMLYWHKHFISIAYSATERSKYFTQRSVVPLCLAWGTNFTTTTTTKPYTYAKATAAWH